MSTLAIIMLVLGLAGLAGSVGTSLAQNISNKKSVEDTNSTNLQINQQTNSSNVEQAELAYRRSLPTEQVRQLMDAGYSRAGAINSLTGAANYTPPLLQSAHLDAPLMDFSQMSSAFERLNSIPSNVEQFDLIQAQRHALEIDTQNKINQDNRAQELHDFNMWRQRYDKNTALMLDSGSSKVANALLDSGKTIEDFKDFESMIRDLNLDKDKDIRNLNFIARQQLEDGVRAKFDSETARRQQQNVNRAADDKHSIDVQQLQQLSEDYNNSVKEHRTQDSERLVREGTAKILRLANMRGISDEELKNSIYFNSDGEPKLNQEVRERMRDFWSYVGSILPIEYLGDILRGIVSVGK